MKEIWDCTCVTAPPFFSKTGPISVRNSDMTATRKCGNTDEPVVIVWDGLNEEEREGAMRWMSTAKPWVLWKQRDSLSTIKKSESTVEGKLQSLLEERGWSLTGKGGKTKQGSKKNRQKDEHGNRRSLRKWIWGRDTERRLDGRKCSAEKLVALWTSETGAK